MLSTHYAVRIWIDSGLLMMEQARAGTERSATVNPAHAADLVRSRGEAVMVASPGMLARLAGFLQSSGHVRA